jgi:hypothetical protein
MGSREQVVANVSSRLIAVALICLPLLGCISFPEPGDPGQRYERDTSAPSAYDRIHENMDTQTYNESAGALAKGNTRKFEKGLASLENSNSQFNRRNAGNLRAVATCAPPSQPKTTPAQPCTPK